MKIQSMTFKGLFVITCLYMPAILGDAIHVFNRIVEPPILIRIRAGKQTTPALNEPVKYMRNITINEYPLYVKATRTLADTNLDAPELAIEIKESNIKQGNDAKNYLVFFVDNNKKLQLNLHSEKEMHDIFASKK